MRSGLGSDLKNYQLAIKYCLQERIRRQDMTDSDSPLKHLDEMRERANCTEDSLLLLKDWNRIIRWEIDGDQYLWRVEKGSIHDTGTEKWDINIRCTRETLRRLSSQELGFFIALWATDDVQFEGSFSDALRLGYIFLNDNRSRRVVFLAHCFLNMNTRFPGGSAYRGATEPLIEVLLNSGAGIVQMPCPEFLCLGLAKQLYGELPEKSLRECFRKLAEGVVDQMQDYLELGYEIMGVIGMNPSPSCGVEITKGKGTMLGLDRDASEKEGSGVFIEELQNALEVRGLERIPFFGIRRMLPGESGLDKRLSVLQEKLRFPNS